MRIPINMDITMSFHCFCVYVIVAVYILKFELEAHSNLLLFRLVTFYLRTSDGSGMSTLGVRSSTSWSEWTHCYASPTLRERSGLSLFQSSSDFLSRRHNPCRFPLKMHVLRKCAFATFPNLTQVVAMRTLFGHTKAHSVTMPL